MTAPDDIEARILEKAEYVEEAITVLAEKQSLDRATYRDSREQQAIVEREFQTAIEACIDIAGLLLRALDVTRLERKPIPFRGGSERETWRNNHCPTL